MTNLSLVEDLTVLQSVCKVNAFKIINGYYFHVFSTVPAPQVSIAPDNNSTFIRGTKRRSLSCFVTYVSPLPDNPNITLAVTKDGNVVNFDDDSRLIPSQNDTTGSLTFQPLRFSDAGNYTCIATASDQDKNQLIIPSSTSRSYIVTVQGKGNALINTYNFHLFSTYTAIPVPNITFISGLVGRSPVLNCTVDVLDNLYNINVDVRIVRSDGVVITSDTGSNDTTLTYTFYSLRASDAGGYQCLVNITQDDINYQFIDTESTQVNLTCKLNVLNFILF